MLRGVESDGVRRFEAYPAEDVEMDMAETVLADDEFHEEPQFEEQRVLEEVPNAVRLAVMRINKNLGQAKNCCVMLCELVEPIGSRSGLRVNSNVMFTWRTDTQNVTCLQSWQIRTLNSIKPLEWTSLCYWTQTNKCLSS